MSCTVALAAADERLPVQTKCPSGCCVAALRATCQVPFAHVSILSYVENSLKRPGSKCRQVT
jgi:hypothetical protein